ncbi:MAG TPA: hypothetical protein VHM48_05420 [Candidatus Limnocylindrales bacterium]|nr:hypothetical protein [Candidatus Limnocylindrales bacterium]
MPARPLLRSLADRFGGWTPALLGLGLIVAFLVSRLPLLDADIPQWELTVYSPIDEFTYSLPAFNLVHYGTWLHQAASWAPLEGQPTNVLQNVVVALTLKLFGSTFWGLRMSSILFGLVGFLSLVSIVRIQADEARRFDAVPKRLAWLVVAAACVLLLVDFSSLLSARIVEPTISRIAVATLLIALVARGVFLGERHGLVRSGVFGATAAAAVSFVYIYNAFLVPGALVALVWWAYRRGGWAAVGRHTIAFLVGCVVAAGLYYGLIYLVYGHSPIDWYRAWISPLATSSRGNGLSLTKIASILEANIFRLDPAFVGVVLASIPVFAWTLLRRPNAWMVLIAASLAAFLAQTSFVADYPERKFIMVMIFALPVAAAGVFGWRRFQAWVTADHRRLVAATVWLTGAVFVAAWASPFGKVPPHGSILARIVLVAGLVGAAALVALLIVRRPRFTTLAALVLAAAILVPLAYADLAFVYRRPTFTYRDAQIAATRDVGDQETAGSLSFGMQLYNGSRSVLNGVTVPQAEYEADIVRFFREGGATSMYAYADPKSRTRYESLGFRLVETLPILLPRGMKLGRYVFGASGAAVSDDRG